MPRFQICVVNREFESRNEQELPSLEAARAAAIKGALEIGVSEVGATKPFYAAEVSIACDGEYIGRYVVSVGVSPLR